MLAASTATLTTKKELNALFVDREFKERRHGAKRCFVCQKKHCWSTKQTTAERLKAVGKNKTYCLFLTTIQEDEQEDKKEEIADEQERLVTWIEQDTTESEEINDDGSAPVTMFCTPFSIDNSAAFLAVTGSQAVLLDFSASLEPQRYTEGYFYGVLIDSGCADARPGGYMQ